MDSASTARADRQGGAFLIGPSVPDDVFTPEQFTDEHAAIAQTTEEFFWKEVEPRAGALDAGSPDTAAAILRKSADLGIAAVIVPEQYGGMELDLISDLLVTEWLSGNASYSLWHIVHGALGMMPLLLFGDEEQKQRYLPKLSSGEMVAGGALSEPAASGIRATLTANGRHYILNGENRQTLNAPAAGLFPIFAKMDDDLLTAFLVERGLPGLGVNADGDRAGEAVLHFEGVHVPVENVLGEPRKGEAVAAGALSLARLKLAAGAVGHARRLLDFSIGCVKRGAAGKEPVSTLGLLRDKLAGTATRLYAAESVVYRVAGMIQNWHPDIGWSHPAAAELFADSIEEFQAECTLAKILATETLGSIAADAVRIREMCRSAGEPAPEGTFPHTRLSSIPGDGNENNRLSVTTGLLGRSAAGRLPLVSAINEMKAAVLETPADLTEAKPLEVALAAAAGIRRSALLAIDAAFRKYATDLDREQEILAGIGSIAMEALAAESACLRAAKLGPNGGGEMAAALCGVLIREARDRVAATAGVVLAACGGGDSLRTNLAIRRRLLKIPPADVIASRRWIAGRLLETERYII